MKLLLLLYYIIHVNNKVIKMKHLPLLLIPLFLIVSCEEEEGAVSLVGTWNIASITNLGNKDCTVDADSTDDGDLSDIGEWSGTMVFTDSTGTADYTFSFEFQKYCELLGGTMEGATCTVEFGSEEISEGMFEEMCLEEDDDAEYSDSKCNMSELFEFYYTLDGSEFCEFGDRVAWTLVDSLGTGEFGVGSCGTIEVTKTSATITMPNHADHECDIIELAK